MERLGELDVLDNCGREVSAVLLVFLIVLGTMFLTFGILFLFGRCLFLLKWQFPMSYNRDRDAKSTSVRVWACTCLFIMGFMAIIASIANTTSWLIGICGGSAIAGIVFALVYVIDKRLKKRGNG